MVCIYAVYIFDAMKAKEERKLKTYKVKPSKYKKAKLRCDKNEKKLATIIESIVESIGDGAYIIHLPF